MPTLTYPSSTGARGGLLNGRLLIGRKLAYGISFADNTVSRLHAWIDPDAQGEAGGWVLIDTGSRTGTFVNDQQITRHHLSDGDVIRIGNNRLHFSTGDDLPGDVMAETWTAPAGVVRKDGILFQCACGAPLWVGNDLAGKRGICRHCRQPVTVPPLIPHDTVVEQRDRDTGFGPVPVPVAEAKPSIAGKTSTGQRPVSQGRPNTEIAKRPGRCGVCHGAIAVGESITTCPDCAIQYHAECWQENLGCSTYGCPQVNYLKPAEPPAATAAAEVESPAAVADIAPADVARAGFPWELMLLAASVISLLAALAFGSVSAVVVVGCLIVMLKHRPVRWGLLIPALLIGLAGFLLGLVLSDFWWFSSRHTPAFIAGHLHF